MARRARTLAPPEFCVPMQPRQVAELPTGKEWTYEIKWDGYRALALKHGKSVRLLSRNNKDLGRKFPSVIEAVTRVNAASAIIDGEIVGFDEKGRPSFQALQNQSSEAAQVKFLAFDLLHADGDDLRSWPLEGRRQTLRSVLAGSGVIESRELLGDPRDIAAEARRMGLEGIVAKRRTGHYVCGEAGDWVKLKLNREQEFVVGGYDPPVNGFHALVIGYFDRRDLICCGRVRAGFNAINRSRLVPALRAQPLEECPFANLPMDTHGRWGEGITAADMANLRWVKPRIVVQIGFVEWTRAGLLRHPTFRGIREDKKARDVGRES